MRFLLGGVLAALLAAVPAAGEEAPPDALTLYRRMAPRGEIHFSHCWRLEHDYYDLRRRIAETSVVWRRQELEREWAEVRDRRREICALGW